MSVSAKFYGQPYSRSIAFVNKPCYGSESKIEAANIYEYKKKKRSYDGDGKKSVIIV